jgi:hypothetical protein
VVPPEKIATLDLTLPLLYEVKGQVAGPEGEPVQGATVILRSAQDGSAGTSEEDGSFSIEVEEGSYTLFARKQGYPVARLEEPVTVAGSPVEGLEIQMSHEASISGRILGLSPEALLKVSISVEGSPESGILRPDGTYRIDSLGPGEWQVTGKSGLERVTRQVTILPGQEKAELDLLFSPGDLTLSGRIVAYRSLELLEICLGSLGGPASVACLHLDPDRSDFRFPHLRPGRYLLSMIDDHARNVFQQEIDLSTDLELMIPIGKQP